MTDSYNPALEALQAEEDFLQEQYDEEVREEQAAAQERNMQQKQEALDANLAEAQENEPSAIGKIIEGQQESVEMKQAAIGGLIDTALGVGTFMDKANPFGDPFTAVKDVWDKANPISEEEPMHRMVRKISGVAIPSLYGGGLLSGAAKSTAMWGQLGGKGKLITEIGAHLSADLVVTTASTSATDENLAATLNENFGTHIPWATKSTDSPNVKYWKQMFDTAGLSVAGDLIGVLFGFAKNTGKGTKYTAKGLEGEELLVKRDVREAALVQEATESPALKAMDEEISSLNMEAELDEAIFFGEGATDAATNARIDQKLSNAWDSFKSEVQAKNAWAEQSPYKETIEEIYGKIDDLDREWNYRVNRQFKDGDTGKFSAFDTPERRAEKEWLIQNPPSEQWKKDSQLGRKLLFDELQQVSTDAKASWNKGQVTDPKVNKYLTEQIQTEEGLRRLEADPQGVKGYDPFVHTPSNPVSKAIPHPKADPIEAVVDIAEIKKYPTLNPRPAPIVTEHYQKDFMRAADGTERAAMLHDLFSNMPKQIDAIREGRTLSADDMKKAVDSLTSNILGSDVKKFAKDLNTLKTRIVEGQKFIDQQAFITLSHAFRKAFDDVFDPNTIRASAMMVQQAGNTVSDASRVANSMGDFFDVTRQTEIAFDNLELVATELRANQYIRGLDLQSINLTGNSDIPRVAQKLEDHRKVFEDGLRAAKEKAKDTVETLKDITKNNPEYRKAFTMAFDATGGDVNTLAKMHAWAAENLGIIQKGIYDRNPKIPSLILKGLNGVRYNSVLSGLSAVRAAWGNATVMMVKPVSALAGSAPKAIAGDAYQFKRALASYSGFMESVNRARKVMANDWGLAVSNPQEAMRRGRADLNFEADQNLEILNAMKEGLRADGKEGKIALINIAQQLSNFNNNPIPRFGINAMFAIDGFTNSMMASASARAKAFDELFEATNGAFKRSDFNKLQQKLYDEAFDAKGVLTDKAAKHASSEIALNLDNDLVNGLQTVMDKVPASKALFMFMRTGLNAVELSFSFTPVSSLPIGLTKAQRLFKAKTPEQILEVLSEHGIDKMDPIAFQALKSEYVGRQIMGASLITGTGLMALNGQLTGNGPQDAAERYRMQKMGWKPLSIRNPFTGKWHSYKGFEPFQSIMGLTADVVYHANRVDQAVQEDIFRKISQALQLNVTNSTFMSGLEPLVALQAGDESAWARFTANNVDSLIPFSGARGLLSKAVTSQVKDVKNEWQYHLANRNKFLFNNNAILKDALDVYTGEPIRYFEGLTAAANAFMPAFKSNGGMEPWRQWLLDTGWDNLQIMQTNPLSKDPVDPATQQWINNWIGKKYPLVKRIEEMMNHPHEYWDKKIKEYKIGRGNLEQKDFPIKQLVVHQHLDELHRKARQAAWKAYKKEQAGKAALLQGGYKEDIKQKLRRGNVKGAKQSQQEYLDVINIAK